MCCSGVLFDYAKLKPEEADFAQDIGLDVMTMPSGKVGFAQPCKFLCDDMCSRYETSRPAVCGHFFCKLARRMDEGQVSEIDAHQRVHEAQTLLKRIAPLLRPDETFPQARARWRITQGSPVSSEPDAQLFLLIAGLSLLLDRHFRREGKETMELR